MIKVERVRHDLTQADLAKKIQVSRQTIHVIEKGKFVPSTVLALKMARFFEIKVEDLFMLEKGD